MGSGQRLAARALIESGRPLFLPKTVSLDHRACQEKAVASLRSGLDIADALHHASCRSCELIASFDDNGFDRRIQRLTLQPKVLLPS